MRVPPEIFDAHYDYFYGPLLAAEQGEADAELIARLLSLGPGTRVPPGFRRSACSVREAGSSSPKGDA
jgi:hypothetical protein